MTQKGQIQILIGILIVSLLALGGYFIFTNYSNNRTEAPVTQSTSQPSPTSDPTANWKTYTNAKYGITIKYPANFTVSGDLKAPSDMDGIQFESISFKSNHIQQGMATSDIQIAVLDNPKNLSLDNWIKDKTNLSKYTILGVNIIGEPIATSINGYRGFKMLGKNDPFPNNVVIFSKIPCAKSTGRSSQNHSSNNFS